jgi:uncharacterized protein (TIRG00374 family)
MKRWQLWLGFVISTLLLWWALSRLDLAEVWAELRQADYVWLLPGVGVYFLGVWARAWRWHFLLRPIKRISVRSMFPVVAIGYMGNNIYPVRAGEVLRSYVLRRREGVSISASLATIFVEKAFDGVVMLGFVFLNLSQLFNMGGDSGTAETVRLYAIAGAIAFLTAVLIFLVMAVRPEQAQRLIAKLIDRVAPSRYQERLNGFSDRFISGLASLRSPSDVGMVLVTSVVIWLFETGKYWFVMHAFPFEVSFFALMLMNGVVNLATSLPSLPGYLGTFDVPGIAVLEGFGVTYELAAGYTLVLHAALWLPITLLGIIYMAHCWSRSGRTDCSL